MVAGVVRWLQHSFDFHFPLSAVGRQGCHLLLSLTAVTVRVHTHPHANTFACDESRASGAISRNAGAINSLQISLYRHYDGPVLISLYYPLRLSCVYAVTRPIHPCVPACHRAGVRAAKLSSPRVIFPSLLYLSQDGEHASAHICRNRTENGMGGNGGSKCTDLSWVEPNLTIALGDLYRHHHITLSVFH